MGEAEGVVYFPGSTPQNPGSLNPKGVHCHSVPIWTNTQVDVSVKRCKASACLDHNFVPTAPSQTPFAGRASFVDLRHSRCHRSDANCRQQPCQDTKSSDHYLVLPELRRKILDLSPRKDSAAQLRVKIKETVSVSIKTLEN